MQRIRGTIIGILLLLGIVLIYFNFWLTRDHFLEIYYDFKYEHETVSSRSEIDQILSTFEKVSYAKLNDVYKQKTKSAEPAYKKILANSKYYKVYRRDMYRRIVGNFRIKHFLSRDEYYRKSLFDGRLHQYWLINKNLLYKILELQEELIAAGYDKHAFIILDGHRHPKKNETTGGASKSRHIKGEAADLKIGDINKDGRYSNADKDIVLKILDKKVIKNKGGIGRYPNSRSVHMDVRGSRARWDTY